MFLVDADDNFLQDGSGHCGLDAHRLKCSENRRLLGGIRNKVSTCLVVSRTEAAHLSLRTGLIGRQPSYQLRKDLNQHSSAPGEAVRPT